MAGTGDTGVGANRRDGIDPGVLGVKVGASARYDHFKRRLQPIGGKPRMFRRWDMESDGARERQRLFDLFTRQPGHQDLTQGMIFYCPLCRRPFGREALAAHSLLLTLAHIIPDALGGTWTTLACIKCNND